MDLHEKQKNQIRIALLAMPIAYTICSLVSCADGYHLPKDDDYKTIKILPDLDGDGIKDLEAITYQGTIDTILSSEVQNYKLR